MKQFLSLIVLLSAFCAITYSDTEIDFTILGVIASSNENGGIALIKNKKTGKVTAFKAGNNIDDDTRIKKIKRKTVTFVKSNKTYSMRVGDDTATERDNTDRSSVADNLNNADGIERVGNRLKITRELKENLIGKNLNKILMQAAAVPYTKNGKLIGFKLLEIDEGSIYNIAGIQNGDIVTHINDLPINDAGAAIRALTKLKKADTAKFGYIRNNVANEIVIESK